MGIGLSTAASLEPGEAGTAERNNHAANRTRLAGSRFRPRTEKQGWRPGAEDKGRPCEEQLPCHSEDGHLFEQEPTRPSFYLLQSIFYVAKNFMAIKSCKGKILLGLPVCSKGPEAALKGDGPQDPQQLNVHPDPGPSRATGQLVHSCPTQMPSDGETET